MVVGMSTVSASSWDTVRFPEVAIEGAAKGIGLEGGTRDIACSLF
jgi:hypothetical protein